MTNHAPNTISAPTPGPWAVQQSSNPGNGASWRDIVSTGGAFGPSYVGEALERDAYLIAAAPDLLAACEFVLAHALERKWDEDGRAFTMISSALRKATGGAA